MKQKQGKSLTYNYPINFYFVFDFQLNMYFRSLDSSDVNEECLWFICNLVFSYEFIQFSLNPYNLLSNVKKFCLISDQDFFFFCLFLAQIFQYLERCLWCLNLFLWMFIMLCSFSAYCQNSSIKCRLQDTQRNLSWKIINKNFVYKNYKIYKIVSENKWVC